MASGIRIVLRAVIQDTKADIIGLQEVDFQSVGAKKSHQLDYLAEATGMRAVAGPTIRRADIVFGNALLTCREIIHVRFHDLTVVRRQPRGVIDAEIVCDGKSNSCLSNPLRAGIKRAETAGSITDQDTAPTKSELYSYSCHRRHKRMAPQGIRSLQSEWPYG